MRVFFCQWGRIDSAPLTDGKAETISAGGLFELRYKVKAAGRWLPAGAEEWIKAHHHLNDSVVFNFDKYGFWVSVTVKGI